MDIKLLRSDQLRKRPNPVSLLEGQPAININSTEPGMFFKTSSGTLVKVGPTAITSNGNPPNTSPATGGSIGNSAGEFWLDKSAEIPILKVYDGSSWLNVGSVNEEGYIESSNVQYEAPRVGSEVRTALSVFSDRVSVKDFGAVGNGTADDTEAIQAAIDSGAKAVFFPEGDYKVSGCVSITSGQTLYGEGTLVAAPELTPSPHPWFANEWAFFSGYQISDVTIKGLKFKILSTSPKPVTGGVRGIYLKNSSSVLIDGCFFTGKGGLCGMANCSNYTVTNCYLEITADWADGGIHNWCDSADGEEFQILNNRIEANEFNKFPILVTGSNGYKMRDFSIGNNSIRGAKNVGIYVNGRDSINESFIISSNTVTGCQRGIRISDSESGIISNNIVTRSGYQGIVLDSEPGEGTTSANYCQVTNNILKDNNQDNSPSVLWSFSIAIKDNSSHNLISGNTITGSNDRNVIGLTETSSLNTVKDNIYFGSYVNGGIFAESSQNGEVNYVQGYNGDYSPIFTDLENINSVDSFRTVYSYSQGIFTVESILLVQVTSPDDPSSFKMTLPTVTDLEQPYQISGHVSGGKLAGDPTVGPGFVIGDTTSNKALVGFSSSLSGPSYITVSFTYYEWPQV